MRIDVSMRVHPMQRIFYTDQRKNKDGGKKIEAKWSTPMLSEIVGISHVGKVADCQEVPVPLRNYQ